jgi:hypothetical protein
MPVDLTAPLVFAGYGLSMPDAGHDDFAGIDVKGKIVVVVPGGPENVSGARKANARSERTAILAKLGAVGLIQISTPKQTEIPWARQIGLSARPSLMLKDDGLRDVAAPFLAAMVNPKRARPCSPDRVTALPRWRRWRTNPPPCRISIWRRGSPPISPPPRRCCTAPTSSPACPAAIRRWASRMWWSRLISTGWVWASR